MHKNVFMQGTIQTRPGHRHRQLLVCADMFCCLPNSKAFDLLGDSLLQQNEWNPTLVCVLLNVGVGAKPS